MREQMLEHVAKVDMGEISVDVGEGVEIDCVDGSLQLLFEGSMNVFGLR